MIADIKFIGSLTVSKTQAWHVFFVVMKTPFSYNSELVFIKGINYKNLNADKNVMVKSAFLNQ